MRIVEPQKASVEKTEATTRKPMRKLLYGVVVVFAISFIVFLLVSSDSAESPTESSVTAVNGDTDEKDNEEVSTTLSGNHFRIIFNQTRQANVQNIPTPPPITGNIVADTNIRTLAESRGYKLRSVADSSLSSYLGIRLQSEAATAWDSLRREAARDGVSMAVVSGYRSIQEQRRLFLERLVARGASISEIERGEADAEIIEVLKTTAVPGYSKHHSGYTIDLLCAGTAFDNFKNSECHDWLVFNNYERPLKYGFIPSYPEDADLQGPEPEAWEYVWVGDEVL